MMNNQDEKVKSSMQYASMHRYQELHGLLRIEVKTSSRMPLLIYYS